MLDVTPKALKVIRKALDEHGPKAVRVVFEGFG